MSAQLQLNPQGYRVAQAAAQIDVSKRFLEREIQLGKLPVVRLGPRCVRVRAEDLAAYMRKFLFVGPPADPKKVRPTRVKEVAP